METLLADCVEHKKNPIYFVRYEDLLANPQDELAGVMKYLLDVSDLSGTVAEKKIGDLKAGKKVDSTQNKAKFTQEQTDAMKNDMAHLLYYFGYTNHSSKSNPQEFFKFD